MAQGRTNPQEQVMTLDQLLREKCDDIKRIAVKHGAYNIRVFGSVARGEDGSRSWRLTHFRMPC
jgi:hypothetical protein